ncbi:hypothetical protein [Micropruina sp.]|uniref:hypothetical protein n=1 Tax=Micropruina sp. TaxID=2737536 RepID=UPI0039E6E754
MTAQWLDRFNQAREVCPVCGTDCQGEDRPDFCADPQDPAQEDSAVREFYWYHSSTHENWPDRQFGPAARLTDVTKRRMEAMGSGVGAWASRQKTKALHVGTYEAAIENMLRRMDDQGSSDDQFYLYRLQLDPNCVIEPGVHKEPTNFVGDAYLAEVCAPGTNVFRYVNVHEDASSVSLAIEPDAVRAVQGIPIPLAVDATDPWVTDATARLSEATSKPAPRPKGKLQRYRLREVSALATEARRLESEIATGLPLALRERFTVGFDEAGFNAAPAVFPSKLVGLARLVTDPRAILDSLDAQPWRRPAIEGEAVFSR